MDNQIISEIDKYMKSYHILFINEALIKEGKPIILIENPKEWMRLLILGLDFPNIPKIIDYLIKEIPELNIKKKKLFISNKLKKWIKLNKPKKLKQIDPDNWINVDAPVKDINTYVGIASVVISSDGQTIVSCSYDNNTIKIWNIDGSLRKTLEGHTNSVNYVALSSDGQTIISGSWDKTIKIWNIDGTLRKTLVGHTNYVSSVALSSDGQTIISGSDDNTIKIWNIDGTLRKTLIGHTKPLSSVALSFDGQTIVSGSGDNTIKIWKIDGTLIKTFDEYTKGHTRPVTSVTLSSDGQTIVSGSMDDTIKIWNIDGTLKNTLEGHTDVVYSVALSSDGQTIVSGSWDNTIKIWNIDGTLRKTLIGHTDYVYSIALSSDGQTIVSGSYDKTIKIWNIDGTLRKTLEGYTDNVNSVTLSSNGQTIISGSYDNTIKIWNIDGTLIKTLVGHTDYVYSIALSSDGQTIVSGSEDNTIKIWKIIYEEPINKNNIESKIQKLIISILEKYKNKITISTTDINNYLQENKINTELYKNFIKITINTELNKIKKRRNLKYTSTRDLQNTFHSYITSKKINNTFYEVLNDNETLNLLIKKHKNIIIQYESLLIITNNPKKLKMFDTEFNKIYNELISLVNSKYNINLLPNIFERIPMSIYTQNTRLLFTYDLCDPITLKEDENYIQQIKENNLNILYCAMEVKWEGQLAIDYGGPLRSFYNKLAFRDSLKYFDKYGMIVSGHDLEDFRIIGDLINKVYSYDNNDKNSSYRGNKIIPNYHLNMNGLVWILLMYPNITSNNFFDIMRTKIHEFEIYELVPCLTLDKKEWILEIKHNIDCMISKDKDKTEIEELEIYKYVTGDFFSYLFPENVKITLTEEIIRYIYRFYKLLSMDRMVLSESKHIINFDGEYIDIRTFQKVTQKEILKDEGDITQEEILKILDYLLYKIRMNPGYTTLLSSFSGSAYPNLLPRKQNMDIIDFIDLIKGSKDYDMEYVLKNFSNFEGFSNESGEQIKKALIELSENNLTSNKNIKDLWETYIKTGENFRKIFIEYVSGSNIYNYSRKLIFSRNESECDYIFKSHTCSFQLDISSKCLKDFKFSLLNSLRISIEDPIKMGMLGGKAFDRI